MRLFNCTLAVLAWSALASAGSISLVGSLDPNNPNDVFVTTFMVKGAGIVTIQTYGYGGTGSAPGGVNAAGQTIAAGGFDPYVSLFVGPGGTSTFLASNDDGQCPPGAVYLSACRDSTLQVSLDIGMYTLAITQPQNFSFAENGGSGELADGFIGLATDYGGLRPNFAVDIKGEMVASTPDPGTLGLIGGGIGLVVIARKRRRQRPARNSSTQKGTQEEEL